MRLQHLGMLKRADNERGFIQCTIKPEYRKEFEALGFVDHIDLLPKLVKTKVETDGNSEQGRSSKRHVSTDKNKRANSSSES